MQLAKLAETVLLQLECFWVLQELDKGWRSDDQAVVAVLEKLYASRPVTWSSVYPLVRLNTVLALLAVPIAFASRLSDGDMRSAGFRIKESYSIACREDGQPCELSPREVMLVLRNAVAHLPDFAAGTTGDVNISFAEGVLRCWSSTKSREVIFQTESGFIEFLRDFVQLCRAAARKLLSPE